jgi:hypothetical protein
MLLLMLYRICESVQILIGEEVGLAEVPACTHLRSGSGSRLKWTWHGFAEREHFA